MITPAEIREKTRRLYPQEIDAWLNGTVLTRYPWRIPANLRRSEVPSERIKEVENLRQGSKEIIGFGYSIQWERIKSLKQGDNNYPTGILIDSQTDLLKLAGKLSEFQILEKRVGILRARIPELEPWIRSSWSKLVSLDAFPELVEVADYLKSHPRPGCFVRELPLAISTKCIQDHRVLLTDWLNIILPPETIDCDCSPKNFDQRFGFRAFRKHILVRVLDPCMLAELGLFSSELSLPPQVIPEMKVDRAMVVIVENRVNLLTLPELQRGIAFFGEGKGVTQLFAIPWMDHQSIWYWGDLDVEGFQILAMLRRRYPHTKSILMDMATVRAAEHLATAGTGTCPDVPSELYESEAEAFLYIRERNLRIEQEHLMQNYVEARFSSRNLDRTP